MKHPILILGRNTSTTLGVVRSLGKVGYEIDVLYVAWTQGMSKPVAQSKYVRKCTEIFGRIDERIINEIKQNYMLDEEKYVLLPTDDYTASLIDRYRKELSPFFLMPYIEGNEESAITRLMDKSLQSQLAGKCGLETVNEWVISLNQKYEIPPNITYPCFVKPLQSFRGYKKDIGMCSDEEELKRKLSCLQVDMPDRFIMIQEYLSIDQEYSMSGVCIDQEVIIPALIKKIEVGQRERGVSIIGEITSFDQIEDIYEKLINFMRSLHYYGMFDIDLMVANGKIYFGELNLRSSGTGYAVLCAGVNLPDIFVRALSGDETWKEQNREIKKGMKFFYDKTAWEDFQYGYITRNKLLQLRKSSDFSLLIDPDDPKPGKLFLKDIRMKAYKAEIKRWIKKILGRK